MRLISLSKGQFAKVDDADYKVLSTFTWHARWNEKTRSYYAARNQNVAAPGDPWHNRCVWMHRQLLGLEYGDKRQGDHQNGDTLDCQRHNLRIATASQNAMNRKRTKANTSGIVGVSIIKNKSKPWRAFIKKDRKMIWLGDFPTKSEAIEARRKAEPLHFGAFVPTRTRRSR